MAYYIEEDGNGNYYIKDYYGRYIYQKGTYTSTNVGNKSYADESNCKFTITPQSGGTFKILNTTSKNYYLANLYNNAPQFSWRNWANLGNNQYLPWLYKYTPDDATAISTVDISIEPAPTRKVLDNGRITIEMPYGMRFTLQGVEHQ